MTEYVWINFVGPEAAIAPFKAALEIQAGQVPPVIADMLPAGGQPAVQSGIGSEGTPMFSFAVCVPEGTEIERPEYVAMASPAFSAAPVAVLRPAE